MGILYSQPSSLEEQKTKAAANNYTVKGRYDARDSDRNNNAEHVVIIPMDLSKHAEGAFECEFCSLVNSSEDAKKETAPFVVNAGGHICQQHAD